MNFKAEFKDTEFWDNNETCDEVSIDKEMGQLHFLHSYTTPGGCEE